MADSDSRIPWFSGLCLKGEVAAQYRIEGHQGQEVDPVPAHLELDNLAPITIFVGANNSGKSRLLRDIFSQLEPVFLKLGGVHHGGGGMDSPEQPLEHLISLASAWDRVEGRQGRLQRRFPVPIAPLWRAWPRRAPCPAPL